MIGLFLAASAFGGDLRVGGAAGFETVVNDPFQVERGLRLGFLVAPRPFLEIEAAATWFPYSDLPGAENPTWSALSKQMLVETSFVPDLSFVTSKQTVVIRILPFEAPMGAKGRTGVGAHAGYGIVHTHDNLEALGAEGEASAMLTEKQWHPGPVWGLGGFVSWGLVGLRVDLDALTYLETVNTTTLEHKNLVNFSAVVVVCSR